jgi:hypothetical protein
MIQTEQTHQTHYTLCSPYLPLAVYREVAAHLRQVEGVEAELLPQPSTVFDYFESQIGGLRLTFSPEASTQTRQRVDQILAYYGDRHGNWQLIPDPSN